MRSNVLCRSIEKVFLKILQIQRKKPVLKSFFQSCEPLACNFDKKRLQHNCFPVNFAKKFLFAEHLRAAASEKLLI